jgi:hypothetical protein
LRRKLTTCATSSATVLRATRTKAIAAEHRPPGRGLERHAIRFAALVAGNLKFLALGSSPTALARSAKVLPALVSTGFAALGMCQSTLAIVFLFSLSKRERISALGAGNFKIWHRCLPGKNLEIDLYKLAQSLLPAMVHCTANVSRDLV